MVKETTRGLIRGASESVDTRGVANIGGSRHLKAEIYIYIKLRDCNMCCSCPEERCSHIRNFANYADYIYMLSVWAYA